MLARLRMHGDGRNGGEHGKKGEQQASGWSAAHRVGQAVLRAKRTLLLRLRGQGTIDDKFVRLVERELDLVEQHDHEQQPASE